MTDNACCALDGRGLIAFDGADARTFLHSQLTCDVAGLSEEHSTYGAYCTPKGRALASFLLWPSAAGFLLQLPQSVREPVQKRLALYILRSKVKASDATPAYAQYGVAGPDAAGRIERVLGTVPRGLHKIARTERGMALALPVGRYLLVVAREHAATAAEALGAALPVQPESWWDRLDIEAGVASVLPETQEQFVPQMLNLDAVGGVSFTKGCYPGQEIVARMRYLGRVKERMFRARVPASAVPHPGDRLYGTDLGAQAAGMIVNAAPAATGEHEVLAVVQLSSVAAGPVRLGPDGPPLVMETLPYALPEK